MTHDIQAVSDRHQDWFSKSMFWYKLCRFYNNLIQFGAVLGAFCIGLTVTFYVYEVVSRYFFNSPSLWVSSITVYLLLLSTMLVLPYITREKQHVSIDFLVEVLPKPAYRTLAIGLTLISGMICLLAAYFSLDEAIEQYTRNTRTNDIMQLPKWWLTGSILYGFANSAVLFLASAINSIITWRYSAGEKV